MVGEIFEISMSEMPTNVVNCQKSDFPPGRNLKIQSPLPKPFLPKNFEKSLPPDRTLWKILICPQNVWEKLHFDSILNMC